MRLKMAATDYVVAPAVHVRLKSRIAPPLSGLVNPEGRKERTERNGGDNEYKLEQCHG